MVQPYSEKLCAWPLELGVDLWLCTPARLHQISAQSVNQAHTLPLRPGLKINPISLTSRGLTVIHRDEHCGLLTHTHTHTHTDGQILTERLCHVVELLLGTADKHHGESSSSKLKEREDSLNQLIYDKEKHCKTFELKIAIKTSPKSGPCQLLWPFSW